MTWWRPACVCRCGRPLLPDRWRCVTCARAYDDGDGVLRWITAARLATAAPFLSQYRSIRERDGYRVPSAEYYRRLPVVAADDPQFVVWQVRRESFVRLRQLLLSRFRQQRPSVLDLGAGNGWLSHRLADVGCRPVAVDLLDDEVDGLGACRHYERPFTRVQADFDDLPFAPRQFDVVVFNGSLHYAPDVAATLMRASALLAPGGVLAVVDSPAFVSARHGEAMCARTDERFRRDYGVAVPVRPGQGFVTLPALAAFARQMQREAHFFESRGPQRWAVSRVISRVCRGLVPPRFGVWMAT